MAPQLLNGHFESAVRLACAKQSPIHFRNLLECVQHSVRLQPNAEKRPELPLYDLHVPNVHVNGNLSIFLFVVLLRKQTQSDPIDPIRSDA